MPGVSSDNKDISLMDEGKIQKAVSSIIEAIGEDTEREGLVDTPQRVAQMYEEFFSGLKQDPAKELETGFEEGHKEMVILRDITFFSICEHHFLPFYGTAHIGYMPNGRVVGASKLARALDILARRPQIQERLTDQIAETVYKTIQPEGVAVVISAEHMCMSIRGVKKPGSKVVTSASRGTFKTQTAIKQEFISLLRGT